SPSPMSASRCWNMSPASPTAAICGLSEPSWTSCRHSARQQLRLRIEFRRQGQDGPAAVVRLTSKPVGGRATAVGAPIVAELQARPEDGRGRPDDGDGALLAAFGIGERRPEIAAIERPTQSAGEAFVVGAGQMIGGAGMAAAQHRGAKTNEQQG